MRWKLSLGALGALIWILTLNFSTYCSNFADEAHVAVSGDYVYVLPINGAFKKIDKQTGRIFWESEPARGSCTTPVFTNDRFLTIEMFNKKLLSVDCETGEQRILRSYDIGCSTAEAIYSPLFLDDIFIAFGSSDIQASRLSDQASVWRYSCRRIAGLEISDWFRVKDKVYIFSWFNPSGSHVGSSISEFEMVELDPFTGQTVHRFNSAAFLGENRIKIISARDIGLWNGKQVILTLCEDDPESYFYRLFAYDHNTKRVSVLVEQLDYPPDQGRIQEVWHRYKPLILNGNIIYLYSSKGDIFSLFEDKYFLIKRSLKSGAYDWKMKAKEIPLAATTERFFTEKGRVGSKDFLIRCREASNGALVWEKKFERLASIWKIYEATIYESRLYLLTSDSLHVLDIDDGRELWRVYLGQSYTISGLFPNIGPSREFVGKKKS